MKNVKRFFLLIILIIFPLSCRTVADYDFTSVDTSVQNENYLEAVSLLEEDSELIYGKKSKVLEFLDKGILLHFAGKYSESNEALSEAEKLIDFYYSKSFFQGVGSTLANDTVIDYAGESYEDIYTNIFMCLNYIAMNNSEDAMVEIRRFENKMKLLGTKYKKEIASARETLGDGFSGVTSNLKFHNSALARYLSMLLYRQDRDYDAALVDLRYLYNAFQTQGSLYNFNYPEEIKSELNDFDSPRINFLAFTGRSPVKVENVTRVSIDEVYYKLALPEMQKVPSQASYVNVRAVSKSTGEIYATTLSKLESIENIACDTFSDHYSAILAKTLARSISKSAGSTAVDSAGDNIDGAGGFLVKLLSFGMKITTEVTERADVRTSRFFPASVFTGGLTVPEGEYSVQYDFCNSSGKVLQSSYVHSVVKRGKLSLTEASCYR